MHLRLSELLKSWVQGMLSLWSVPAMGHSSWPWPFPCQHTAPKDSWLLLPLLLKASPELTREQVTHLHWQCQKANRSLSSVCAVPTSPSTSLCRPQLKYILKTHSKAKHLKCKPSLHHLDLVPFPQRFSHLSLSIHPQTWICHEHTIGGFQLPLFTSLAPSRPTELQDTFRFS